MALNIALYTGSAVTVSTTAISLTAGSTSIQTKTDNVVASVWLDTANMAAGDEFEVYLYEKAISGGTQRTIIIADLIGAQADLLFITAGFHVGVGWDFGIKKIAGTDRAFSWSVRSIG
jgi:hypothetical protein